MSRADDSPKQRLHDLRQTAAILNVTKEKVVGFVHSGELKYINVGQGEKRPRYRFTDPDIQEFIEARKQQDIPKCQSSRPPSPRRTIGTTSKPAVVGFTALRNAQIAKTPRSSKP
jgi:hypothetical protein